MALMPGVQFEDVWKAMNSAFTKDSLSKLVRLKLNHRLDHLVDNGPLPDMTFELISLAEREGWHIDLVEAAYHFIPSNQQLAEIYDRYGMSPHVNVQEGRLPLNAVPSRVSARGFERTIRDHIRTFDIVLFREGLALVEGRICRIELNRNAMGTGFLIGPDLVMTNYHVVQDIICNPQKSTGLTCRFDYKLLSDGSQMTGEEVRIHNADWLVNFSEYAPSEARAMQDAVLPTVDQLDYAIIRLNQPIGYHAMQRQSQEGPARGWIEFPEKFPDLTPPFPLIMAQHPEGSPLKIAMDTNGICFVNENQTRVRYETTTEPGSSGSPCFSFDWTPIALHHYGDPGSRFNTPKYNQGIPFQAIREHLLKNGFDDLIT